MGFGYLVLGFLIASNFVYRQITMLIACLLLMLGMLKLGQYNRPLREARLFLCPTLGVAAVSFVYEAGRLLSFFGEDTAKAANNYLSPLSLLFFLLFTWRLLAGIHLLAVETDLPKIAYRAKRNTVFTFIAEGLWLFLDLPITAEWYNTFSFHAAFPVLLCRVVVVCLNAWLLYGCYMQICLPEDVDMPRHKTGIGFLDAWNEKMDAREEAAQAEKKQALADLYHEREKKYKEKQNQKKGRKK